MGGMVDHILKLGKMQMGWGSNLSFLLVGEWGSPGSLLLLFFLFLFFFFCFSFAFLSRSLAACLIPWIPRLLARIQRLIGCLFINHNWPFTVISQNYNFLILAKESRWVICKMVYSWVSHKMRETCVFTKRKNLSGKIYSCSSGISWKLFPLLNWFEMSFWGIYKQHK